jgi:hypothetical protein
MNYSAHYKYFFDNNIAIFNFYNTVYLYIIF